MNLEYNQDDGIDSEVAAVNDNNRKFIAVNGGFKTY